MLNKRIFTHTLKALTVATAFTGIVIILGTAGSSDNELIPFSKIVIHTMQGFFLCGIAYILNLIKSFLE